MTFYLQCQLLSVAQLHQLQIDLNPLRAGLVDRPEDYRWNSLGYHLQTENKDQFLSTNFGLEEFIEDFLFQR